jgi:glycosyltransferase involved in cell wall biosynthesis
MSTRIAHITTFWPTNHFGHTHYTDNLIRGIQTHRPGKHIVLGEGPAKAAEEEGWRCVPSWDRHGDYVDSLVNAARAEKIDVAFLQYSPDLFGADNRFPRLLEKLAAAGVKTIVNHHSVYPEKNRSGFQPGGRVVDFDRATATHASCIQVHSQRMRRDFLARGIPDEKLAVIAHGSIAMEKRDPLESKRKLGIPNPERAKVVLFFGFIWLGKGVDHLIGSFAKVAKRVPEAFFYIGGYTRKKALYTHAYMTYLRARLVALGVRKRSKLWGDFVPDAEVPTVYSAADVVAMPYRQDYSSVSGVVHQTAGIGKLMLCSRISKFDEVEEISPALVVDPYDQHAWAESLEKLLTDDAHAERMRAKIVAFAEATSWPAVGAQHLALIDRLLGSSVAAVKAVGV